MDKNRQRHKYIKNPDDLFGDQCEEEENVHNVGINNSFRSRFPPPQRKPTNSRVHDKASERELILEKQRGIEQRTLDSSKRALCLLHGSEQIGITAAEELISQHEVLHKANKRLDKINPNLTDGQKHLHGIHSIFYGLKNYIYGIFGSTHSTSPDLHNISTVNTPSGRLNRTLDEMSQKSEFDNFTNHPGTRLRDLNQQVQSKTVTDTLEANLNEMGHVITRLKDLGVAFGEEIDEQNKLIDTIRNKVEDADLKIDHQNKQMNKFLD